MNINKQIARAFASPSDTRGLWDLTVRMGDLGLGYSLVNRSLQRTKGKLDKFFLPVEMFDLGSTGNPDALSMAYGWVYGKVTVDATYEMVEMISDSVPTEEFPRAWLDYLPGWTTFFPTYAMMNPEGQEEHKALKHLGFGLARRKHNGQELLLLSTLSQDVTQQNEHVRLEVVDTKDGFVRLTGNPDLAFFSIVMLYICSFISHKPSPTPVRMRLGKKGKPIYSLQERENVTLSVKEEFDSYLEEHNTSVKAITASTSRSAHMRRAHWRGVWTGPRDGEQVKVLRWIPPTFVKGYVAE